MTEKDDKNIEQVVEEAESAELPADKDAAAAAEVQEPVKPVAAPPAPRKSSSAIGWLALLLVLVLAGAAGCRAMRTEHLYQKYPGHQVIRKKVDQKPHYVFRTTVVAGKRITRRVRSGWRPHYVLVLKSPQGTFIDVAVNTRVFNEVREGQVRLLQNRAIAHLTHLLTPLSALSDEP